MSLVGLQVGQMVRCGDDRYVVAGRTTATKEYLETGEQVAIKGGPGSGHRGHAGRPGKRGGSAPGIATGVLSGSGVEVKGAIAHVLSQMQRQLHATQREEVSVIDRNGRILYTAVGGQGEAVYGFERSPEMTEAFNDGHIVAHSHPVDRPFSDADVASFLRHDNFTHTLIVTKDGKVYRLSKTRNTDRSKYERGSIGDRVREIVGMEPSRSATAIFEAAERGYVIAVTEMARQVGLEYSVGQASDFGGKAFVNGRWFTLDGSSFTDPPPGAMRENWPGFDVETELKHEHAGVAAKAIGEDWKEKET